MKSSDLSEVRKALWATADQMRANSSLGPAEYRGPVLGLIFLAYAEHRFEQARPEIEAQATARARPLQGEVGALRPRPGPAVEPGEAAGG